MTSIPITVLVCLVLFTSGLVAQPADIDRPLVGRVICIDPGHGGTADTDHYRVGITGEREEWVNLRVGLYLKALLEEAGASVILTRTADVFVPLADRAALAVAQEADLFLSIHHNATADTTVSFPVLYYHGHASENKASIMLAKCLGEALVSGMYGGRQSETPITVASDHTIFPKGGAAVLRGTYGIPALIVEASFFTNPAEEQRLKSPAYNRVEAGAYLAGIRCFFEKPSEPIHPKHALVDPFTPFQVKQEADRMDTVALAWRRNYEAANRIYEQEISGRYGEACRLLLESITTFPDSYLAGASLNRYAELLRRMGKDGEAREAERRRQEYYP